MSESSDGRRTLKLLLLYASGVLLFLMGLVGLTEGVLGFLGGLVLIVTSLVVMPWTRQQVFQQIQSRGGPDLNTLGNGMLAILIVSGVVAGMALMPTPESAEDASPPDPSETATPTPESNSATTHTASKAPASTADDATTEPGTTQTASSGDPTLTPTQTSSTGSSGPSSQSDQRTSWTVIVISVTDGDTMDVRMPDGSRDTIRLLGVDTPETSASRTDPDEWPGIPDNSDGRNWLEAWGSHATDYAHDRLGGREIYIETDPESDRRGTYDRLLVYAYQSDSAETSFNLRLIQNGYARMYDTQFAQRSVYQSAEAEAQENKVGVWDYSESTTKTPMADGGQSSSDLVVSNVHADAEGNDHENLNDEYVEFTNEGGSAIEMGGWRLSDEADHTYYFPRGFTLDAGASVTVYTGNGSDTEDELYWGSERAVWNNNGDTIYVTNDDGETVIEHEYSG